MKQTKNLPVLILVAGVWLSIVFSVVLTSFGVEHWMLTGWIFTALLLVSVVGFASLVQILNEIDETKKAILDDLAKQIKNLEKKGKK